MKPLIPWIGTTIIGLIFVLAVWGHIDLIDVVGIQAGCLLGYVTRERKKTVAP